MATTTVTTGVVVAFSGTTAPAGWLMCDGKKYDRTQAAFAGLFGVIGTIYGGDGAPLFAVPDYRGYFLRGADAGRGADPDVRSRAPSNAAAPDLIGSTQADGLAAHAHVVGGHHLEAQGGGGFNGTGLDTNSNQTGPFQHDVSTTTTGGNETRPKNIYVHYIIAL